MRRTCAALVVVWALGSPPSPAAATSPAATPSPSASPAGPKPLTFDAVRQLVEVSSPQISPDGTRVAYVRSVGDFKADERKTEIELVDVASGTTRALTHGRKDISTLRWSPDGDRLAFLAADTDKTPQLFVMPMNGGDALQVTTVKAGVSDFAWRPDGAGFAFAAVDKPAPLKPDGFVAAFEVTDEHYLTREASLPTAIWTVAADGTGAKRITSGTLSTSPESPPLAFTPDGKSIVALLQPDGIFASLSRAATMRIDATTGAAVPIVAGKIDGGGPLSHDGTKIALAMPRHGSLYLETDVSIRSLIGGSEVTDGTKIDRNVHWTAWTPDDRAVYVGTADGVRDVLWRLGVDGSVAHVDLGDVDFGFDGSVAKDGTLAFVGYTRDSPGEIYVESVAGGAPKKLTSENGWISDYAIPKKERIDWQSDGMAVDGVLTYPVGYVAGKTYPLVLDIHGGPVSTSTWDFGELSDLLATHGYLVLQPNYRGSDNSGDAFLQAIVGGVTSGPGRDNLRGVEAVKALGIVDPSRIGVSGWSGGGLQTSWLVGHADFWRAAVTGASVDDWFEQAVLSDINEDFAATFLGGSPWTTAGMQHFVDESPSTYAAQIKTPLLILSDIGDQRVPVTQSFALYRALHDRGKTVTFMAWPRAGHFPNDPVGVESVEKAWSGWFDRWFK
jgi:dipeptidyl aminopeptidase/acylaminoacyl peptidase